MTFCETAYEMEVRHIAEQEGRIARQLALIERLRSARLPIDNAVAFLDSLKHFLEMMHAHLARLSK
jgi:hypothetical protein